MYNVLASQGADRRGGSRLRAMEEKSVRPAATLAYSPQYRSYHSEDEVRGWSQAPGFEDITLLPQRVSAIGTRRGG